MQANFRTMELMFTLRIWRWKLEHHWNDERTFLIYKIYFRVLIRICKKYFHVDECVLHHKMALYGRITAQSLPGCKKEKYRFTFLNPCNVDGSKILSKCLSAQLKAPAKAGRSTAADMGWNIVSSTRFESDIKFIFWMATSFRHLYISNTKS